MDRDLLRQCLTYHGESLFNKLKCEQIENPDFQAVVSDLCKATCESKSDGQDSPLVEQFIARKADILFSLEPYAIMPPMELFMEVSYEERRTMLYRDLEKGDILVGRINNIREYGFFLTLLCTAGGLRRDIEDLELSALCHIREVPSTGSHDDPLSYYQIGDFIRAAVKDIDRYQEKITVSLQQAALSPGLEHIKLGVFPREELPIHYSRSLRAAADSRETYECILKSCHGYHNPSVVEYLLEKVGVSDTQPPSMMRGLQSKLFHEEDFASAIRKRQSASWALKCVRAGVDHFKHGRHVEAMNEYNKALDIDTNNVEALVARGALYANKGSIMKAITDFELALENCPDHRNAKKYLCQTLVERGKQLEEQEKLVTAEGLYRKALSLDESNPEAQEALHKITETIQVSIRLREEAVAKEQEKATSSQTSAEKLRKILKEEKRMKKKRKRSASSNPSSTKGGPRFGERDEGEAVENDAEDKRISQLYSLSAASEDEESDSSQTERKRRDGKESRTGERKNSQSQEREERGSRSGERKDKSSERGREDNGKERRGSDSKRRSSLEENRRRTVSCSSAESAYSRKSNFNPEYLGNSASASKSVESRVRHDSSKRNSFDGGRYENRGREGIQEVEEARGEKDSRKGEDENVPGSGRKSEGAGNHSRQSSLTSVPGGSVKKDLPSNLLDIFNQIAQFKKGKGGGPRK
ncbi:Tetratricopeptide repeat protein 14 [Dissostichus eleginoides]|uniref:Tetratricopeptide repeat protein 14 n=1 Tax=Dissostichus eleginoides TaxID=100907 RepID=A0AAD9C921_DISEL|nr:Tetratricopeptide repeat protein 14 [Dissostichus eleginoides]